VRPKLTLCADDFGYSRGTSEIIAGLARGGRINAVSCMTLMPRWPSEASLLAGLEGRCQVGLHITLTGERPLSAMARQAPTGAMPTANTLGRQALLGRLPLEEIAAEVAWQFAAFTDAVGRMPDFVDSHQHVHHLPGIRTIVLEATARLAPSAWVRSCSDRVPALLTRPFAAKAIGSAWHSRGFNRLAASFGLATNLSFAGHYDFSPRFDAVFPRFLDMASEHHLVMTHPGADDRLDDPIALARPREAKVLETYRTPPTIADRLVLC
jgi:predicted glycoside hydrolase/deacetylase ChbG (UPF0249 family)